MVGLLSYPISVRAFPGGRLLVVEASRACLVAPERAEVTATLPPHYRNLADAWVIDGSRALLLEGGMRGEGRLLLWDPITGDVDALCSSLTGVGGIAADERRSDLLLSLADEHPRGRILSWALRTDLRPHGAPRTSVDGLHVPRYFCPLSADEWLCSSGHGPARFHA
jgi:hypothetical protein